MRWWWRRPVQDRHGCRGPDPARRTAHALTQVFLGSSPRTSRRNPARVSWPALSSRPARVSPVKGLTSLRLVTRPAEAAVLSKRRLVSLFRSSNCCLRRRGSVCAGRSHRGARDAAEERKDATTRSTGSGPIRRAPAPASILHGLTKVHQVLHHEAQNQIERVIRLRNPLRILFQDVLGPASLFGLAFRTRICFLRQIRTDYGTGPSS